MQQTDVIAQRRRMAESLLSPAQTSTGAAPAIDGMELLFGTEPRPGPQRTQSAPGSNDLDGEALLFGSDQLSGNAAEAPSPYAEAEAPTWWGRRVQDFRGRQDPREAETPRLTDQYRDLASPVGAGALFGSSDEQMADIIQHQLGDRFVRREKDANGYDVFVTRSEDGQEQRGYVNKPGFEGEDVARGILGAIPYVAGGVVGGAVTKGLGGLLRMGAHAGIAGSTSVAGDVAQMPLGSKQGIELDKAAFAAGAGAAGVPAEWLGTKVWGRFVVEPRLFNRSTGKLTAEGEKLAIAQGLDPAAMQDDIARTFAKTYARTGDASRAAVQAQEGEFGIPSTAGQRSKDPWQLTQEEAMRRNLYGERARDTIQAFDARQAGAVDFAARTRLPSDLRAETARQHGTMNPRGMTNMEEMPGTADLGTGIQSGMRHAREMADAVEDKAWGDVTDILPRPEAFDLIPDALAGRLGGLRVTPEMPKAAAMAKALDAYKDGKAFAEPVASVLKQSPVKTVDEMRRQLLGMYKSAADPTDQAAAKAIYDGFNDWIDEAAKQSLLAGDAAAAANLRIARDTTRTMQGLFNPSVKGRPTAAARLMRELETADSPERAVQILFGPASSHSPSTIKSGAVEALKSMKAALRKYADPRIAGDTIGDMKIAYWARLVQNKQGAAHTPGVMLNNVKAALANQRTLMQELYSPAEIGEIKRLALALDRIVYKPPNASGSGYTAAGLAQQFFGKLFDALGMRGAVGRTLLEYTGVTNKFGSAAAKQAVSQQVRQMPRNALPYTSTAGATHGRQGR